MDFAPGLSKLQDYVIEKNPNEPDPFIIRRVGIPHWLGGYEALDGIFVHSIGKSGNTPAHYHFVTAGLSDLYADDRVRFPYFDGLSGFGIELTMKVIKTDDSSIPQWPVALLQRLARYIFETGNRIVAGDDIPWGESVDLISRTNLNNLIATQDLKYSFLQGPSGRIDFVQLVPVTQDEYNAAHNWSPDHIINLMTELDPHLLIADVSRGESIFDLAPELLNMVQEESKKSGSDICSYSAQCSWNFEDCRDAETDETKEVCRIKLSPDGALTLQKSIQARFKFMRHLTLKSPDELHAITFFPEGCQYSTTSASNQFKTESGLLQLFIAESLIQNFSFTLPSTKDAAEAEFEFLQHNLIIEISDTF